MLRLIWNLCPLLDPDGYVARPHRDASSTRRAVSHGIIRGASFKEADMAIRTTQNLGMLLLAIWLILTGIAGFTALPIPSVITALLAFLAGILILIGR